MKRTLLVVLFLVLALAVTLGVMRSRGAAIAPVPPASPRIVSFTATPRVIGPGETSTLAWMTQGVATVAMEWGPEAHPRGAMQRHTGLPPSGTLAVQPSEDTIYVIECEGDSGQVCSEASATVRVRPRRW